MIGAARQAARWCGPLERLLQTALAGGVFAGAVALVAYDGKVFFHRACGTCRLDTGRPVGLETLFDLASLTKPLATAAALMVLVADGKVGLDDPVGRLVPELAATDKAGITPSQLLAHCSGLPAYRPFFTDLVAHPPAKRRRRLRQMLARTPLAWAPASRTCYSDLGYMVLCWLVETVAGCRMDRFLQRFVYGPLGIADELLFVDLNQGPLYGRSVAATEYCPWRGRVLAGEVHDDNAWAAGGIEGHAGLFGTARAVWRLLEALMQAYGGGGQGPFDPQTVRRFLDTAADCRPLGFDRPAAKDSAAGSLFGPGTVGHLGFTGTSFWLDPARGIGVILLANRVHPHRHSSAICRFRPVFCNAAVAVARTWGKCSATAMVS